MSEEHASEWQADVFSLTKTVVAAGTLSAVAMAVPHAAWEQPRTLRFDALTTHETQFDRGRHGFNVGDKLISTGRLIGLDGRPLGTFGTSCIAVDFDPTAVMQCQGYDKLPDGQVTFAGELVTGKKVQVVAITGGTGDYQDARGQLSLTSLKPRLEQVSMLILE